MVQESKQGCYSSKIQDTRMTMNRHESTINAFFSLVRAGLWEIFPVHDSSTSEAAKPSAQLTIHGSEQVDWEDVYQLAEEQSVVGLVTAGINWFKVHGSRFTVPQEVLFQMIGEVQLIEQQKLAMNKFVAKLIEMLRKEDIYALLIKGQGIAQCYERPLWRCCGDVDLFLSDENYNRAKELLAPIASEVEKEYIREKHLGMTIDGFVVELHGSLQSGLSLRVEKGLDEIKRVVFYEGKVRSWMNGSTHVFLPNADEDVVYVFTHMLQHFYKEGLGLKQVCDWCRLLWTYRRKIDINLLEKRLNKMGLKYEWKAFGAFAVEYLGMPSEAMPFYSPDNKWKRKANKICAFILEVGNMGQNRDMSYFEKYPYFIRKVCSMGRWCSDLIRHARIFPLDSLRFFPRIMVNGVMSAVRGE